LTLSSAVRFKIALSSFVPTAIAFWLPKEFRIDPIILAQLLILTGVITLIRRERRHASRGSDGPR
jgi:hypothetical protein